MSKPTASRQTFNIDFTALSAHVDACLHELIDRGYAKQTMDQYRRGLHHFCYWVTKDKTAWNGEDDLVRRFLSSTIVRPGSKRKYNALTTILSGSVASPLKPARSEPISFVDSYTRASRAAQSTSVTAAPCKFVNLLWTLWKDGSLAL